MRSTAEFDRRIPVLEPERDGGLLLDGGTLPSASFEPLRLIADRSVGVIVVEGYSRSKLLGSETKMTCKERAPAREVRKLAGTTPRRGKTTRERERLSLPGTGSAAGRL